MGLVNFSSDSGSGDSGSNGGDDGDGDDSFTEIQNWNLSN